MIKEIWQTFFYESYSALNFHFFFIRIDFTLEIKKKTEGILTLISPYYKIHIFFLYFHCHIKNNLNKTKKYRTTMILVFEDHGGNNKRYFLQIKWLYIHFFFFILNYKCTSKSDITVGNFTSSVICKLYKTIKILYNNCVCKS